MDELNSFPMFGGWSVDFYIGYNLPLWDYLSEDDNTGNYVLNTTFGSPFPQLVVDEIEVRVILPEVSIYRSNFTVTHSMSPPHLLWSIGCIRSLMVYTI
jgi:hypothetical protein